MLQSLPTRFVPASYSTVCNAGGCASGFTSFALVVVMVAVGGAPGHRSGLSITEWRPVKGSIPPLSEAAWAAEF